MVEKISGIDKFNDKVQKIQEDLRKIRESVLSETKRKEKLDEIRKRAENAKIELEKSMNTMKDKAKEEAKALMNSLNEIINFKLSIGDSGSGDSQSTSSSGDKEKGVISRSVDWLGDQWSDIFKSEKWRDEKGKNILRTVGFAATGIGAVALVSILAYKGIKKLKDRASSQDEAQDGGRTEESESSSETIQQSGSTQQSETTQQSESTQQSETTQQSGTSTESAQAKTKDEEKKSFWDKWYGQTLKWLGFGAGAVGGSYLIGRYFSNKENSLENKTKEKIKEMQGLESDVKNLKNQANECLRLSNTYIVDHEKNKENYDKILAEALDIQEKNKAIFDEVLNSQASEDLKEKAQSIKNNIENYINEIKNMDEEISKKLPKTKNWWGDNENKPEGNEDNIDENKPVDSSVISEAVINYIDSNVNFVELNDDMKKRIKTRMNKYLKSYPMLKKDKDNHITFEIWNKKEFSSMVKDLWNIVLSGMSREKRGAAILIFGNGIGDLDKSMKNLDSDKYEKLIFNYFGGIIKGIVKSEGGNLSVQEYYDSISKYYPNKNADKISSDLATSGQSNKDIKDMKYPLV